MFKLKIYLCIVSVLITISLSSANDDAKIILEGNNKMLSQLYPKITKSKENLIFSPLSIHAILSLVYQGSAGTTEEAFKNALHISDKGKTSEGYATAMQELNNLENITLNIANHVYVKTSYKLKASFGKVATEKFAAGVDNIDFAQPNAAATINAWVEEKTNKKIKDLIKQDALNADTRMVLINAVYFKGDWATPFDKSSTVPDKFYVSETDSVPCEMMYQNGDFNYKDDNDLKAQVIQLPYKNKALSMVIILPHSKTGLAELETKIASIDLETITKGMREEEVDLSLPKFKIESKIELNEPLKESGLAEAFGDKANFSELLESPEQLQISEVVQKAFLEVNEEGAEAAAATAIGIVTYSAMIRLRPPKVFRANHGFLAIIKHKNNALFMAKLEKTTL